MIYNSLGYTLWVCRDLIRRAEVSHVCCTVRCSEDDFRNGKNTFFGGIAKDRLFTEMIRIEITVCQCHRKMIFVMVVWNLPQRQLVSLVAKYPRCCYCAVKDEKNAGRDEVRGRQDEHLSKVTVSLNSRMLTPVHIDARQCITRLKRVKINV